MNAVRNAKCSLISVVLLGSWAGCQREQPIELAASALAQVDHHISQQPSDFDGAHDFLLAAIRIEPGSLTVFEQAIEFAEKCVATDPPELELAADAIDRAEGLIPFHPIDRITASRSAVDEAKQLFASKEPVAEDPLQALLREIDALEIGRLPAEIEEGVLAEYRSLAIKVITADAATPSQDLGKNWQAAKSLLDAKECELASRLYSELAPQANDFEARTQAAIERCEKPGDTPLKELGTELRDLSLEGLGLCQSLTAFADAKVSVAGSELERIQELVNRLRANQLWVKNLYALKVIKLVTTPGPDLSASERLRRLAKCDEESLTPYVYHRFHETWKHWQDELETEEERVEADKARVIKGVVSYEKI